MNKKITGVALAACMLFSSFAAGSIGVNAAENIEENVGAVDELEEVGAYSDSDETGATDYGLASNVQQGQILQCWNWSFTNIKNNMKKIAEQGFSAIQTSPIQGMKEQTTGKTFGGHWWVFYQPVDFSINTNSNNALGTKTQFKAMCDEAHKYGVKVIVDAVLNHMANQTRNNLSPNIISDIRNDNSCWHSITQNTSNWKSRWDITHNCMDGLPDLNTGNSKVQNYAIKFLKECIDNGADGFRFDGAKHIEVPNDYENASSNYWSNVLGQVTSYAKSKRNITPYYYGEVLDETGGGQQVTNQYTNWMSITCNGISNEIRNCVNSGNASGAKRTDFKYSDKSQPAGTKAVLWNESHDTYADGKSSGQSETTLKKTWGLVGTRAEACGMYLARPSNTGVQLGTASTTGWASKEVQAINQFNNYMIGKSEYLSSSGSIAYNERGTEGVVLVNCGGTSASVNVKAYKMASGTYTDAVTGSTFTVSGGQIKGQIGSTGIAVVYNPKPAGPTAWIEPGSKTYKTDTLTLTLKYSNAIKGEYSINNGAYQTYTDGQTITIGQGVSFGEKTIVTVRATDGTTTSDPEPFTYVKMEKQTIYFDNSSYKWSAVYCYLYLNDSVNNGAWPGTQMKKDSATGYYYMDVPDGFENGKVIFTESSNATTNRYPADMEPGMDLNEKTMIFKANHAWEEYIPDTPVPTNPVNKVLVGDTDGDGSLSINDATEIQAHLAHLRTLTGNKL
ncbi:MAG: starch-binding protein, partial [Ruminococcus sp.]|nr:starch-binding protein [Ruminococcus sp.]